MRCDLPCFFKHVAKTTRFRIFLEPRGYGSVFAFPSFSVARSSKTASETNFGHILSHAWPKNFDFVASEAIRSHFQSPIQPYMVRKYSFRGFRNSFGHFQWPIPRLIFGICWALAQKCLCWSSQHLFFDISWPSAWFEYACFEIPETHFGNFSGPWSEILNIEVKCMFFAFFQLAADFSCAKLAFSKHVDNRPFHWSCSLAVLTVSVVFVCFLFLTMNLSWFIFAVFKDLA